MTDDVAMPPLYTVTGQAETYDRNQAGQFVQGTRVDFRTASGATGSVFVPYDQLQPMRVAALIRERAQALEAIARLGEQG